MRSLRLWLSLLVLAIALSSGQGAQAHAFLTRALPAPDAVLPQAPSDVQIQFSEEVEAPSGALVVYDGAGRRVEQGDGAVDPHDVTTLRVGLKPLQPGAYTVAWHVLSTDGHPVSGQYGFQVGPARHGAVYYNPEQPSAAATPPGVLLSYWLATAGLLALAGLGFTQGAVVRARPTRRYRAALWVAAWAAIVGAGLLLVSRTAQVAGTSWWDGMSQAAWLPLLATAAGQALLWRLGLLAATLLLMRPLAGRWAFAALAGSVGLLSVAMGGHAVAMSDPLRGVLLDWLHLLAAALWAGGLLQFALALPGGGEYGLLVRRFSPLAVVSLLLLAVTGLYPALAHVPGLADLGASLYGQALMVKLGLVLPLLTLGGINLIWVGPRLRRRDPGAVLLLRRLVTAEVLLMALTLGAAALLTNSPPPR